MISLFYKLRNLKNKGEIRMSIHRYPSKKAKSGYLYLVKVYRTRDGQRADHIKRGFRTRKEAKDYEARLI